MGANVIPLPRKELTNGNPAATHPPPHPRSPARRGHHLRRQGSRYSLPENRVRSARPKVHRTSSLILLDDVGFGASSAFGGPCDTPVAERLAAGGLKYTRFHTTALCAPTTPGTADRTEPPQRRDGSGVPDLATSTPGYNSTGPRPQLRSPRPFKLNGYSTAHLGKCHEVPMWETSPMGPFDQWPTGSGLSTSTGSSAAAPTSGIPGLYEGTTPVEPTRTPEEGYHLTEDLADHAIGWMRQQKTLVPDKPFFLYSHRAPPHAPHHAPKEWIDRCRGRFGRGSDSAPQDRLRPAEGTRRDPRGRRADRSPGHESGVGRRTDRMKPVLAREIEVCAGFLSPC